MGIEAIVSSLLLFESVGEFAKLGLGYVGLACRRRRGVGIARFGLISLFLTGISLVVKLVK